jgi:hypothetical protein
MWLNAAVVVAFTAAPALPAFAIGLHPDRPAPSGLSYLATVAGGVDRIVAPASLYAALVRVHATVPAFSRQTGLACSSCHYQFLQLTPFGRLFKLNGYTLTGLQTIGQPGDTAGRETLKLSPIPQLAAMVVTSLTQTSKAQEGTQNATVAFPDQFSLFAAGQMTPNMGLFTQFTYAAADGSFGIDNIDVRYANHGTLSDREVIYGVTLHNNPTVQDVWNTVPAWGFPFTGSETAPSPSASTLIDGGLGQQVVGLGAYSLFNNMLYAEFTAYRSAQQGVAMPLDSDASNVTSGVIPYWRLALQHEAKSSSLMIGTYGFDAHLYQAGVTGLKNHYADIAADAQVEERSGSATWIGRATYIRERQTLTGLAEEGGAETAKHTLSTLRANAAYLPNLKYGVTLGYFQTNGTTDAKLYAAEPLTGSRTGSPNSSGGIGELDFNPWQNTRLGLQYIAYSRFNGASSAYDITAGRDASDNNTLYLFMWVAF